MWEDAPGPCGDDHVTKRRNRKLIRVTSSNECLKHMCVDLNVYRRYLNQIYMELTDLIINMTECSTCRRLENPRWRRSPTWISENANNSELDRAICAKFGGQMHHGHAYTHNQNSKPELFLRDAIVVMNKDVYITRMSGT